MDTERDHGGANLSPEGAGPQLSVVLPVYNEGENITGTLTKLTDALAVDDYELLVVYDFDEDTTVPVVRALQASMPKVVLHKNDVARGALGAIRAGFRRARAPYVVVTMADLSDDPADIEPMLALAQTGVDVVAASRYMRGGRQVGGPFLKRTLSRLAGLSLHWVAGVPTHDSTNNFKLYSRRLLDAVTVESTAGFELALELTVKAHLLGMGIAELPTTWRDRTAGASRFKLLQWLPQYLRWYRLAMLGRIGLARVRVTS